MLGLCSEVPCECPDGPWSMGRERGQDKHCGNPRTPQHRISGFVAEDLKEMCLGQDSSEQVCDGGSCLTLNESDEQMGKLKTKSLLCC